MANIVLPKGPRLEHLFCKMLETKYNTLISSIETYILFPLKTTKRILSYVKRLENVIYKNVNDQLDVLIQLLNDLFVLEELNKMKVKSNFCDVVFQCEAILDLMVEYGILSESQKTNYSLVEKYVCRGGITKAINGFFNEQKQAILDKVLELQTYLNNTIDPIFDGFITNYNDILNSEIGDTGKTIFEILSDLSKYVNCAFAVCDFASTASNANEDYFDKLYVKLDGSNTIDENALLGTSVSVREEIDEKFTLLTYKVNNFSILSGKVDKDDIMKDFT